MYKCIESFKAIGWSLTIGKHYKVASDVFEKEDGHCIYLYDDYGQIGLFSLRHIQWRE